MPHTHAHAHAHTHTHTRTHISAIDGPQSMHACMHASDTIVLHSGPYLALLASTHSSLYICVGAKFVPNIAPLWSECSLFCCIGKKMVNFFQDLEFYSGGHILALYAAKSLRQDLVPIFRFEFDANKIPNWICRRKLTEQGRTNRWDTFCHLHYRVIS